MHRRLTHFFVLLLLAGFGLVLPAHDHALITECGEHDGACADAAHGSGDCAECAAEARGTAVGQNAPSPLHRQHHHHKHDCSHCGVCQFAAHMALVAPKALCVYAPAPTSLKPWLFPERAERPTFVHTCDSRGPPAA